MPLYEVEVHGTYSLRAESAEDARQQVIDRIAIDEDHDTVSVNSLEVKVINEEKE